MPPEKDTASARVNTQNILLKFGGVIVEICDHIDRPARTLNHHNTLQHPFLGEVKIGTIWVACINVTFR